MKRLPELSKDLSFFECDKIERIKMLRLVGGGSDGGGGDEDTNPPPPNYGG